MACVLAGMPVALVNPTYPPDLLAQMLDNLDPALVFTDLPDTAFAGIAPDAAPAAEPGVARRRPGRHSGVDADRFDLVSFMHTSGTTGVPKFCAQTHSYFLRLGRAIADAMELTARRPGARPAAAVPHQPARLRHHRRADRRRGRADRRRSSRPAGSGRPCASTASPRWSLHAPPVEILKRATTAEDAAGHRVRTMFYADGEFMTRFGIPLAVSGYGSTEAAGVSHLHQWRLDEDIPANASRYGGATRADIEDRIDDDGQIFVRERAPGTLFAGYFADGKLDPARDGDGWFATGDLGRRDEDGGLGSWSAPPSRSASRASSCRSRSSRSGWARIRELVDLALWKRPGELVDDEVVLYVVADSVPGRADPQPWRELPAFMRPSHVAQIGAIPRDAAAGKVQRRLLHEQEVLSWTTLSDRADRCPTGHSAWSTCTRTPAPSLLPRHGDERADRRRRAAPSDSARWCSSRTRAPPWSGPRPSAGTASTAGSC